MLNSIYLNFIYKEKNYNFISSIPEYLKNFLKKNNFNYLTKRNLANKLKNF